MNGPTIEDIWPLSPLQDGLLFHAELDAADPALYAVQLSIELTGRLEPSALWSAADALLQRHANLRAAFRRRASGEPVQIIPSRVPAPHRELDLSDLPAAARQAELARIAAEQRAAGFDLGRAPALRFVLVELGPQHHRLLFTCHHILLDGWSMPILVHELFALYRARFWGQELSGDASLAVVPAYRTYLEWLAGRDRAAAENAWRLSLDGIDEPTYLVPGGRAGGEPQHLGRTLPLELTARLQETACGHGLTLNTVVQGALAILLGLLTGHDDVVFGAIVSGRPAELPGSEDMIGLFINTLPVRVQLRSAETVGDLLIRVQAEQARLIDHHHLGLSTIQRLAAAGDLFDTLLVFQNYPAVPAEAESAGSPRITSLDTEDATHYPVSLVVAPGDEMHVKITRRAGAAVPGGAEHLLDRLIRVLEAVATRPDRPVTDIDVLSPEERRRLLVEWNDSSRPRRAVPPGETPPVGRAIPNDRAYVLGLGFDLLPAEVPGELYLAGAGLARGYLNRPGLTAERFLPDPFGPPGDRMYRTGDRARWRGDGQLEFLGRADYQVKIRGFRVELVEIEYALCGHPDVAAAVVLAHEVGRGGKRLVAYVVPQPGRDPTDEELRRHVGADLPNYMVPSAVIRLTELPTTAHGKVDREALPAMDAAMTPAGRAPRTPLERALCGAVAEVLAVADVSIDDNFFELGGDSLTAARLVSRMRAIGGTVFGVRDLYESPTVTGLVTRQHSGTETGAGLAVVLPIRTGGSRPPLFCIHPGSGLSWSYAGLTRYLAGDRPIYGIQARGLAGPATVPSAVEDMAAEYVRRICELQPTGPYHLLGWSFGGVVAHAAAVQLQQAGAPPASVALLDSYPRLALSDEADRRAEERTVFLEGLGIDPSEMGDEKLTPALVLQAARGLANPVQELDERAVAALMATSRHHLQLARAHEPARYDGDILFVEAGVASALYPAPATQWKPYVTGEMETYVVDARHDELMQPEVLARIGPVVAEHLDRSSAR